MAPLVRTGGSRHTGLAALPHRNIQAQRELFKGFIQVLEKQGTLIEKFDEGLWSSLMQEVVVKAKSDIRFIFKNGFEIKTR